MILSLYRILINSILLISPIIILYRLFKGKEDFKRFNEKLGFFSKKKYGEKLIWFHGASVGELLSVIPLIEILEKDKSVNQILITTSTISSARVFDKFKFKKTIHQFYPIDHFIFVNSFLNYWKPNIAIFIESEIWPCMFLNLKRKGIKADGNPNAPVKIVDSKLQSLDGSNIGNGSKVNVNLWQYEYEAPGRKGVATSLTAVQVVDLVEYTPTAGFEAIESAPSVATSEPSEQKLPF